MLKIVVPLVARPQPRLGSPKQAFPWYLAEISGEPLIEILVRGLVPAERHQFVFVALESEIRRWALDDMFQLIAPGSTTVSVEHHTAGDLCTVLLALDDHPRVSEILVATAAPLLEIPVDRFLAHARKPGTDGCIASFRNTHPKWCYLREEDGEVVQVAQGRPVSDRATAGRFWFRSQNDLLEAAERQILKSLGADTTGLGVGPVFNEMILMGRRIGSWGIEAGSSPQHESLAAEPKARHRAG